MEGEIAAVAIGGEGVTTLDLRGERMGGDKGSRRHRLGGLALGILIGIGIYSQEASAQTAKWDDCVSKYAAPLHKWVLYPGVTELLTGARQPAIKSTPDSEPQPNVEAERELLTTWKEFLDNIQTCGQGSAMRSDFRTLGILRILAEFNGRRPLSTFASDETVAVNADFMRVRGQSSGADDFPGHIYTANVSLAWANLVSGDSKNGVAFFLALNQSKYLDLRQIAKKKLAEDFSKNLPPQPTERAAYFKEKLLKVGDGSYLGVSNPTANEGAVLVQVASDIRSIYGEAGEKVEVLIGENYQAIPTFQLDILKSTAADVEAERRRVEKELKELAETGTRLAEKSAALAKLLRNSLLSELERRMFFGSSLKDRSQLLDRFISASEAERQINKEFEGLRGLTTTQAEQLKERNVQQQEAAKLSADAQQWAKTLGDASAILNGLQIGGPDLKRAVAAGALIAGGLAQGAAIYATPGLGTGMMAIQIAGVAMNLAGGLDSIFGGGGGGGSEAMAKALADMEKRMMQAISVLSKQIVTTFQVQQMRFDQLDRKSDQVALLAGFPVEIKIADCEQFNIDYAARITDEASIRIALGNATARNQMKNCYGYLNDIRSLLLSKPAPPLHLQYIYRYGLANDQQLAPGNDSDVMQRRSAAANFAQEYYPQLITLLEAWQSKYATASDAPSALEQLLRPAGSVKDLKRKVNWRNTKAHHDLGDLVQTFASGPTALLPYLGTPIDTYTSLQILKALLKIASISSIADEEFRVVPANYQGGPQATDRRRGASNTVGAFWILAIQSAAQETLLAGDILVPFIDELTRDNACVKLADRDWTKPLSADERVVQAACKVLRHFATIRNNLAMWRLRLIAEDPAGFRIASYSLAYDYAFETKEVEVIKTLFSGRVGLARLQLDASAGSKSATFVHVSGVCDSAQYAADVAGDTVCDGERCRSLSSEGVERERERLKACVMAPLPSPDGFNGGTLQMTPLLDEAHSVQQTYAIETTIRAMTNDANSMSDVEEKRNILLRLILGGR